MGTPKFLASLSGHIEVCCCCCGGCYHHCVISFSPLYFCLFPSSTHPSPTGSHKRHHRQRTIYCQCFHGLLYCYVEFGNWKGGSEIFGTCWGSHFYSFYAKVRRGEGKGGSGKRGKLLVLFVFCLFV